MLKPSREPYGYRKLLAYQKAEELQAECSHLTLIFPKQKTLIALADQMDRSARSVKQNIVEGWKRNSTKEYYEFLGFSIGALTELEEDCNDIWKGFYPGLMGEKGVMGIMGVMGKFAKREERGELKRSENCVPGRMIKREIMGEMGIPPFSPSSQSSQIPLADPFLPLSPLFPFDIEKIPFYPLDKTLPPVVQLKLRCKELNYILFRLQKSLEQKMQQERTLSVNDFAQSRLQKINQNDKWHEDFLKAQGLERLENGQIVSKKA